MSLQIIPKSHTLFDSGSQVNLISEEVVKKLHLVTTPHEKPYSLGWVTNDTQLQVTKKCVLRFAITEKFIDELELDVVPLDICGIVLGSPYLYERKAVFYREQNKYHLFKGGVEYIVRAHRMKTNLALVATNQMKMLVNASKKFALMVIKCDSHRDVQLEEQLQQSMPLPDHGMSWMIASSRPCKN